MEFTFEEKTDMLKLYFINGSDSNTALNEYVRLFPNRRIPHRTLFHRLEENLRQYGRIDGACRSYPNVDLETAILAYVSVDPYASSREVAMQCGTCKSYVLAALRKHGFKPLKIRRVHHIQEGDLARRAAFCTWLLREKELDAESFARILWTDEASFTNQGWFNRKNTIHWSPHNVREARSGRPQIRFGFNVWCGLIGSKVIGPYIYQGTLTGPRYLEFLQNQFAGYIDDLPLALLQGMIFMQDGCPAHGSAAVMSYLQTQFPGRVLARNANIQWPARSPDLTPMDFYFWGKLKDVVYARLLCEPLEDVDQLESWVREAIGQIPRFELRSATRSVHLRAQLCLAQNGGHFEHLL